jgi:subtilisin family serine protease
VKLADLEFRCFRRAIYVSSLPSKRLLSTRRARTTTAPQFQICERRLVLSAQLLLDVLPDQTLQMHGSLDIPLSVDTKLSPAPIEPLATAAHSITNWDQVRQHFGLSGKGQTVAVIDSGIAWDHVALGKGFGSGYRVVGGWDFTEENDANPYDDGPSGFHGTHVAGIIGSDSAKYPGVAPEVDLVGLRVFNDAGQGQLSWVEKALQWVYTNRNSFENPITTVNLSIGTTWNANTVPDWAMLEDELQQLYNEGIVVTASAGNSFKRYNAPGVSYPAASPYVIPVASVDDNGQLSDFSQRNDRVIAAPGRNIMSTVPDHLLGRDGKVDDFSTASGTSMAAPYVAGATVLIRQAMEMAGYSDISVSSIVQHLHNTADRVFDSITRASYDRLDLMQAIDAIIPDDNVGDSSATAQPISLASGKLNGWINTVNDTDVYRFTATASGKWYLDAQSDWVDSLKWSVTSGGQVVGSGDLRPSSISLTAGQTYEVLVSATNEIGPFQLDWTFQANPSDSAAPSTPAITSVGAVKYWENSVPAGQVYRAQATQDGIFSVLWQNPDSQSGTLKVLSGTATIATDTTWESGALRVDFQAKAGQWFDIQTPGRATDQGDLALANLLSRTGTSLQLNGTNEADRFTLNLNNGVDVSVGKVHYQYASGQIKNLQIDAAGGSDQIQIFGSSFAESIKMTPTQSTLESLPINVRMNGIEEVSFIGGGGADGAYLYDTDTDDYLISRPRHTEMTGAGYKYTVADVNRIFVHATAGGTDVAYLYDSAGDDRLSVRPQFTSMTGPGYFNYISGFERVYAYGTAGGYDTADIYDSSKNDRFTTSGESASITGPGFASYTKYFEKVNAYATAGGKDVAMLYGSGAQTRWQQGVDFVNFSEANWNREARGFQSVETYVSGQLLNVANLPHAAAKLSASAIAVNSSPESDAGSRFVGSYHDALPLGATGTSESLNQNALAFPSPDTGGDLLGAALTTESRQTAGEHRWLSLTDSHMGESELLEEVVELQSWLSSQLDAATVALRSDLDHERAVLDSIFTCHEQDAWL